MLLLTGCSSTGAGDQGSSSDTLQVVTSFYPLEYLLERVGGDRLDVTNLAAAGVEPHDLELSPKDVARVADADLVVYLAGFQPAVDTAVSAEAPDTSWDVSPAAALTLTYAPIDGGDGPDVAQSADPHFWLDPTRYAKVADALALKLGTLAPAHAAEFTANAAALADDLVALESEWTAATTTCANRDLVTSHNAFGYLAERFDFVQRGIAGLSPEQEPSPYALAATADFVQANGVTTIYYETLASPDVARTVAAETGATTSVLDPIEGLSDASNGADYLAIMRSNLANVVAGQGCT